MKTMKILALATGVASLAALTSGCLVEPYGGGGVVVEGPPPPAVTVDVDIYPDYYCWDGFEYVGIVGGRYYYLGPRNVWIVCEPFRLERFHEWERGHADWREHATPNEHFRPAGRGHDQDRDRGHDRDKGRGRDRGDER